MTRRIVLVAACISVTAISASAQAPQPPFRFERPIVDTCSGPCRLPIDVPLLAGSAGSDLHDFRLFDSAGREVGYVFIGNPSPEPTYAGAAAILPVAPTETRRLKASAFEADLAESMIVDRFRVDGLPAPFLKRVRLEGSGDRERWTLLVDEGTLFDLPDYRLRQVELRFAPGSYRYLRLTWDDTNSGRLPLPGAAAAGRRDNVTPPPAFTTPLVFEHRPGEPGRSYFRVRLPGGHLPIVALDLDVGGGHIMREATVFEARLSGTELAPVLLGRGSLRRVVSDGVTAAALRVPIQPPSDSQLDLVLDDGDNPPIDLKGVTAVFAEQPWIYFESSGGALVARYGNTTLTRPRYDIEAVRGDVKIDQVPTARWGEPAARAADERTSASPLPTAGGSVDASQFRYVRDVPAGPAGLIAIPFDAPALAHSAGVDARFADVRVIDSAGRQVPYVLERSSEPLSLEVTPERLQTRPKALPPDRASRQSVYRLKLPDENLPSLRLVVETAARVFERGVSVLVERQPDARRRDPWVETIAAVRWRHADQDSPAPSLTISLPRVRTSELLLLIDEGDNAPLSLSAAHVLLPAYRARLFRDANTALRLAYGRSDLPRPQYDLALLAPQVLATPAIDVTPSAERPAAADTAEASLVSPRVFWVVLAAAALALLALIARLLKTA